MAPELRKTGMSVVGDVPWGTHFCHFYETKQDLLDTLVPYFTTGLERNECCLWVLSDNDLITFEEATRALAQAVPDLDRQLSDGNIEILSGHQWYFEKHALNLERARSAWDAKLKQALARGYDGLRASADTFWLAEKDLKDFCHYEKQVDDWVTDQRMKVLCTYPLAKSGAAGILDVLQVHQFATARRQGEWQVIQSPESIQAKHEIKRLNEEFQRISRKAPEPPLILRYGVAVLAVIVALIINRLLNINLVGAPAMLFLCALMFSAWYGGAKPSLLAMPLAVLAFAYFFVTPLNSWSVDAREIPRLLLFVLASLFVISLSAAQKRATESLRHARDVLAGTVEELKRSNQALRTENTERKQAEARLYAKEQEYRAIVENAPDQIIRYDREFRRAYVNPAVATAYGLPREALIGKPIGSVVLDANLDVNDDDVSQVRQRIADVFATGKSYEYELNWPLPTGRRYFSVRLFPELDLDGSVTNVLGISRDITERKQAEWALDDRLRFETLLTELSAAFANLTTSEVDREIDRWLQRLVEFLGVDRASFLQFADDWTMLYRSHSYTVPGIEPLPPPPFELKDQFPWITDQMRRGVTVKWERIPEDMPDEAVKEKEYAARLGVKSGLNIPVRMGGSVICAITFTSIASYRDWPDSMLARLRLVGEIFASALESKRAEEELKREKEVLEKIFDNIPVMIGFVGEDGRVKLVNREWERSIGWTLKELQEQNVDIFAEAYPDVSYRQEVLDFVAASTGDWADLKIKVRDGRIIDAACAVVRLSDGTRVAIARDVTESKHAEEILKRSETQLAEAQRLAHVGSWDWDLRTNAVTWSDELYRIFGLKPGAIKVGGDAVPFVHPDDRDLIWSTVRGALSSKEPYSFYSRMPRRPRDCLPDSSVCRIPLPSSLIVRKN